MRSELPRGPEPAPGIRAGVPPPEVVPAPTPQYQVVGSGPLLVYIAGLDGTGELFYKQTPGLARSFRVVTFRSRDAGLFTMDDLTGDVAAIIRDQKESSAVIVGESFGGVIALSLALRFPEMVEQLVIVNSFPRFRKQVRIRLAARLARAAPVRLLWLARQVANRVGLMAEGIKGEDRRRFFEIVRTVRREGYARRLELIAEADLEGRLGEITAPTLFVAATRDLLIPSVSEARRMATLIPHARVKVIEGAGHACLLGDRARLADILRE